MAKQGMARPDVTKTHPRNAVPPVPELDGKAQHTKQRARPVIPGTKAPDQKVYHKPS